MTERQTESSNAQSKNPQKTLLSINLLIGIPLALLPEESRAILLELFDNDVFLETMNLRLLGSIFTLTGILMLLSRKLLPPKYQDMLLTGMALVNAFAAFTLCGWLLQYDEFLSAYNSTLAQFGCLGLLGLSIFVIYRALKYLSRKYLGKSADNNRTPLSESA